MNHVKVTKEYCIATDAHVLAAVPTELMFDLEFIDKIPDEGVLIHHEDWKKMTTGVNVAWKSEDVIRVLVKNKRDILIEVESEDEVGKYPDWRAVCPTDDMREELPAIGINAKFAATLQDALGYTGLALSFNGANRAISVTSVNRSDREGVIAILMPVMIDD
jgi:hypothetical protein